MNTLRLLIALSLSLVSACASYEPTSAPVPAALPASAEAESEGGVAITAKVYRNPSGKEQAFDTDFDEAGIIAVQVSVRNGAMRPVRVRRSDMTLRLGSGREISTISGSSAAMRVEEEGSVIGAALAFGLVGALIASSAEDSAKQARVADYGGKEFQDAHLLPGAVATGFVFFAPAEGTPPFRTANLVVRLNDDATSATYSASVPLNGIGFGVSSPELAAAATVTVAAPAPDLATTATYSTPPTQGMIGQYVHAASGMVLPRNTGPFWRTRVSEPTVDGKAMLIADYEGSTPDGPVTAMIRIFPSEVEQVGTGIGAAPPSGDRWCEAQRESVKTAVIEARNGRMTAERLVTSTRPGTLHPGQMMAFEYDYGASAIEEHYYLFCNVGAGWALSQRLMFPRGHVDPAAETAFLQHAPGMPTQGATRQLPPPQANHNAEVTPLVGTPVEVISPNADEASRKAGSPADIYCRPSASALGVCGHSDPNSR